MNPDIEPEAYDLDLGNQILDELGYARGSDGIRMATATGWSTRSSRRTRSTGSTAPSRS